MDLLYLKNIKRITKEEKKMKKIIAESLGTVHTHTHTHTLCLLNEEEKKDKIIYKYKKTVIDA